jgi:hypothetical protein
MTGRAADYVHDAEAAHAAAAQAPNLGALLLDDLTSQQLVARGMTVAQLAKLCESLRGGPRPLQVWGVVYTMNLDHPGLADYLKHLDVINLWTWRAQDVLDLEANFDRCAALDWDVPRIAQENKFIFEDLTVNCITIRAVVSLSRLCQALGDEFKAKAYLAQAKQMTAAIDQLNWDEAAGCYWSRWDLKAPKLAKRTTCASLLPLYTGLISQERAERLVREHLLNPKQFWLPYVLCFNAKDELDQEKIAMENLMLWRGYCIWTNMNWMMTEGLLNYGYRDEARELTRRSAKMIRNQGFREFYDCRTGKAGGATRFNWPAVVLDMIAAAWPEAVA